MSNKEALRKYAVWIVGAILAIIAFYFTTQVFLLASLPTDARRAADPPTQTVSQVQFVAIGNPGLESGGPIAKAVGKTCEERGCDLLLLLGDNVTPAGMSDDQDTRIDEHIRDVYGTLGLPTYMVLGDVDYGGTLNRLTAIREVRWATRTKGFEMPSSTYFFGAGPVGFWAFDTTEHLWRSGNHQQKWLPTSFNKANTPWRIGFAHHGYRSKTDEKDLIPQTDETQTGPTLEAFFANNICGAFDVFISSDNRALKWAEFCGTSWVTSGGGQAPPQLPKDDDEALFSQQTEGYVWVRAGEEQIEVAFYDGYGTLLFQQARNKEGPLRQE